ncbi:AraC family transcriptional regulator [Paenibacillus filicis]|uniref:AraC family transcriptional regulator n=1 Tax=Paenibacillus filicis TaxID=669464 RepID=A0ABU9DEL1_9BACL
MKESRDIFDRLNDVKAYVTGVQTIRCQEGWTWPETIADTCALIFIYQGRGTFRVHDREVPVGTGHVLLWTRGQRVSAWKEPNEALSMYVIQFSFQSLTKKTGHSSVYREEGAVFPIEGDVCLSRHLQALQLCQQLETAALELQGSRLQYRQTGLLHELLYLIGSELEDDDHEQHSGVARTVDYLHEHYSSSFSLEELASMAGFSPSYYSRLFKKLKGISPSGYMTRLRINRAKELLLLGNESFSDIALHVGYSEEAYFSRMFKKETGYSPAQFVKLGRSHVAIMRYTFNGDLLALGLTPHASVKLTDAEEGSEPGFRANRSKPIVIRSEKEACIADLIRLKPSVIVCDPEWAEDYAPMSRHIAPMVIIPYWEMPWRERLQRIAELVGRKREAEAWLQQYDRKARLASRQLREAIGDRTVIVLRVIGGKLRVYGMQRNIGSVLYQDLQLVPPERVRAVKWRKTVTLQQLPDYEADYILLMASPRKEDRKMLHQLLHSPQWQALSAVRNGTWHEIDKYPWIDYSAWSHDQVIDQTVSLLAGRSG